MKYLLGNFKLFYSSQNPKSNSKVRRDCINHESGALYTVEAVFKSVDPIVKNSILMRILFGVRDPWNLMTPDGHANFRKKDLSFIQVGVIKILIITIGHLPTIKDSFNAFEIKKGQ